MDLTTGVACSSDTIVALDPQLGSGSTLFGQNCHQTPGQGYAVVTLNPTAGRGEPLHLDGIEIPPARETYRILGMQPKGYWGCRHGVNEQGVVVGVSSWDSLVERSGSGLSAPSLVRLVLERAHTAQQALELLTDLIARHGQGSSEKAAGTGRDAIFLLADRHEAFVLETAGPYWAAQVVSQVRAVGEVAIIRQDWTRLAPGLYAHAQQRGWCAEDGNKLDFVATVGLDPVGRDSALRRWGRATFLLEQQGGHVDVGFVRRLLSDHYEGARCEADPLAGARVPVPLCRHAFTPGDRYTTASVIVELAAEAARPTQVWYAFGPPCLCPWFPLFLEGELPTISRQPMEFGGLLHAHEELLRHLAFDPQRWAHWRTAVAELQVRFDQDAEDAVAEAALMRARGEREEVSRLLGSLMENHVELFADLLSSSGIRGQEPGVRSQIAGADRLAVSPPPD